MISTVNNGMEINYCAYHIGQPTPFSFRVISLCCNALFILELFLRIMNSGLDFLRHEDDQSLWNWFDLVCVCSIIVEVILNNVILEKQSDVIGSSFKAVKIGRITRLMRVFRISRIFRFLRSLRVLVLSIMSTLRSLMWALVLLLLIMYGFASVLTDV